MKGGFRRQVYLQETYRDEREQSGTKNLYGSVVFHIQHRLVLFWVPQNHRRVVSTDRNKCRFIIRGISSIFNDNW